jgi:hypothetical protein
MTASSPRSPNVPGQLFGYTLQINRALALLLACAPGDCVSIEVYDDTALTRVNSTMVAEQAKSAIHNNPLANRSVEFWKTIARWIESVKRGSIVIAKTTFRLYVSDSYTPGKIPKSFIDAQSIEDAEKALDAAIKEIGTAAATIKSYTDTVFASENRSVVCEILTKFEIDTGSGTQDDDLRGLLRAKMIDEDIIDEVLTHSLGWVLQTFQNARQSSAQAIIQFDDLRKEITSFQRAHRNSQVLMSLANQPSGTEVSQNKPRNYVKQLNLIDCDEEEILSAINDFLMAAADRTNWAIKGLVTSGSFDDFEKSLNRVWTNTKKAVILEKGEDEPLKAGKQIHNTCMQHTAHLQGMEVPNHFTPGCFHRLADSLSIGWHLKYKEDPSFGRS